MDEMFAPKMCESSAQSKFTATGRHCLFISYGFVKPNHLST